MNHLKTNWLFQCKALFFESILTGSPTIGIDLNFFVEFEQEESALLMSSSKMGSDKDDAERFLLGVDVAGFSRRKAIANVFYLLEFSSEHTFIDRFCFAVGMRYKDHIVFLKSQLKNNFVGQEIVIFLEIFASCRIASILRIRAHIYMETDDGNQGNKINEKYEHFVTGPNMVSGSNGIRSNG